MSARKRCVTCWRNRVGVMFCKECGRSYDRNLHRSQGTVAEMMAWAVRRAFAMQRKWLATQESRPDTKGQQR